MVSESKEEMFFHRHPSRQNDNGKMFVPLTLDLFTLDQILWLPSQSERWRYRKLNPADDGSSYVTGENLRGHVGPRGKGRDDRSNREGWDSRVEDVWVYFGR